MPGNNWGLITDGSSFEALMQTLVFVDDPQARLFGRAGADGGQDARSGDGKTVYQAKYSSAGSFAKAIASAKKELESIQKYRSDAAHPRHAQWKNVENWVLVTNAPSNTTDRQRWDDEVIPIYQQIGLEATYWCQRILDAKLAGNPAVSETFFCGKVRVLLTLPEAYDWLRTNDWFLDRESLGKFQGREAEFAKFIEFVDSDLRYQIIHGPGGVGKSRFMLEAAHRAAIERPIQVFWANAKSMSYTSEWFRSIVVQRPMLLLVDEPPDTRLLNVLIEQMGTHAKTWKLIIASRSPNDPVLNLFRPGGVRRKTAFLPLDTLSPDDSKAMALDLLRDGPLKAHTGATLDKASVAISEQFRGFPVWITLAVSLLEARGSITDIPDNAVCLAEQYLDEIFHRQDKYPADLLRRCLRWLALMSPFNQEDDVMLGYVMNGLQLADSDETLAILASLVARKVLLARGARHRKLEIKPDVMKDYILREWLTCEVGQDKLRPSSAAKVLSREVLSALEDNGFQGKHGAILEGLARTEFFLKLEGTDADILTEFFQAVGRTLETRREAHFRLRILEALKPIAAYCSAAVLDTVRLTLVERSSKSNTELMGVTVSRSQDHVLTALSDCLMGSARTAVDDGLRYGILRELLKIGYEQRRTLGRSHRGEVGESFGTILAGGPAFRASYDDVSAKLLCDRLRADKLAESPDHEIDVLFEFSGALMSLERRWTSYQAPKVTWSNIVVQYGSKGWRARAAVKDCLRDLLQPAVATPAVRIRTWKVLAEAHSDLNRCHVRVGEQDTINDLLVKDLEWVSEVLKAQELSLDELVAARELWDWHYHYGTDPELKSRAGKLEDVYRRHNLIGEFAPLFDEAVEHEETESRIHAFVDHLTVEGEVQQIWNCFMRMRTYFQAKGRDTFGGGILLSLRLGERAVESDAVRAFVLRAVGEAEWFDEVTILKLARGWISKLHRGESALTLDAVRTLVGATASPALAVSILLEVFRNQKLTIDEQDYLAGCDGLFEEAGRLNDLVGLLGFAVLQDFEAMKASVERMLDRLSPDQLPWALQGLVEAIMHTIWKLDKEACPVGLAEWILNQCLRLERLSEVSQQTEWSLRRLIEKTGALSIDWLVTCLLSRLGRGDKESSFLLSGTSFRLSRFVDGRSLKNASLERLGILVDLVHEHLPSFLSIDFLRDIDRAGERLPDLLREKMERLDYELSCRLAVYASIYAVNSEAWRKIAAPVLRGAQDQTFTQQLRAFYAISEHSFSSQRVVGAIDPKIRRAFEQAELDLRSEEVACFVPYWEWRLQVARKELEDAEEEAKEERGE